MGIEYDIFGTGLRLKTGIDFDRFTNLQWNSSSKATLPLSIGVVTPLSSRSRRM
jgi:hypothetical protein